MNWRVLGTAAVIGASLVVAGDARAQSANGSDIVDTAASAGSFNTLLEAVKAAGLEATLRGAGPFTVFAPTDEAFAKLPAGTIEALLQDREKLAAILTYHVIAGRVMSSDVVKLATAKTVNGESIDIRTMNGSVMIDGARVVKADVEAANGVIHVIDTVILPEN